MKLLRSDCVIRTLRADDADGIIAIYAAAGAIEPRLGPITRVQWENFINQPRNLGGAGFRVAVWGGELVGHAESSLRPQEQGPVRYSRIVMAPRFRRQGIGTALLNSLLEIDAGDDAVSFQAVAASDWPAGLAFLPAVGFGYLESDLAMTGTAFKPPAKLANDTLIVERIAPESAAGELAEIHNAAYRADVAFLYLTPEALLASMSGDAVWIARQEKTIMAFCQVCPDDTSVWIESVAVHPDYHGQGIGKVLLSRTLQAAGAGNARPASLHVSSTNAAARRLYEGFGFCYQRENKRFAAPRRHLIEVMTGRLAHQI